MPSEPTAERCGDLGHALTGSDVTPHCPINCDRAEGHAGYHRAGLFVWWSHDMDAVKVPRDLFAWIVEELRDVSAVMFDGFDTEGAVVAHNLVGGRGRLIYTARVVMGGELDRLLFETGECDTLEELADLLIRRRLRGTGPA